MKKAINFLLLLLLCIAASCSKLQLDAKEYIEFAENTKHQLVKKVVVGEHEYTIQLATPEYMVCKEIENSDTASTMRSKRLNELKDYLFFLIKISTTEKSRIAQGGKRMSDQQLNANNMVSYYDQQAVLDIKLYSGDKEIKPATYHFENNYDLSPYNTIIVGFETGTNLADMKFSFNDRYTNIPAINAFFSQADIHNIPQLNLNN